MPRTTFALWAKALAASRVPAATAASVLMVWFIVSFFCIHSSINKVEAIRELDLDLPEATREHTYNGTRRFVPTKGPVWIFGLYGIDVASIANGIFVLPPSIEQNPANENPMIRGATPCGRDCRPYKNAIRLLVDPLILSLNTLVSMRT